MTAISSGPNAAKLESAVRDKRKRMARSLENINLSKVVNFAVTDASGSVTQLLHEARAGDKSAMGRLFPLIYDELRRLAASICAANGPITRCKVRPWSMRPTCASARIPRWAPTSWLALWPA